jgi:hypothetical protein
MRRAEVWAQPALRQPVLYARVGEAAVLTQAWLSILCEDTQQQSRAAASTSRVHLRVVRPLYLQIRAAPPLTASPTCPELTPQLTACGASAGEQSCTQGAHVYAAE